MTIDWWTLGLQAINVLILVWLLGWLFWRPMASMIAARRAAAQSLLAEAEAKRAAATAALADIDRVRAGFAAERAAILEAAAKEAEQQRAAAAAAGKAAAQQEEEAARKRIAEAEAASAQVWARRATDLAVALAGRLAARLDGSAIHAAFLDWLLREIAALSPAVRQSAMTGDGAITVVSATPLSEDEQARCAEQIRAAIGGSPALTFTTDPSLIAGLELRAPGLVIRNSWRADLDRAAEELTHDLRH
jgi:F-type H+-transporting ATPase subunit b